MVVLGINAYHGDAAACLVVDGVLVAAVEEERFRRLKHWAGLPTESVRWCLGFGGISLAEVDHIAVGRDTSARLGSKLLYALRRRPSLGLLRTRAANQGRVRDLLRSLCEALGIDENSVRARVHPVEHHLAHLVSAYYTSPFSRAVCVSLDGFGDFSSTMVAVAEGDDVRILGRVAFPHSLGAFYTAGTQYLGFHRYGDEYKVMGLAPHGEPEHLERMRDVLRLRPRGGFELDLAWFRHHRESTDLRWDGGEPRLDRFDSPRWAAALGACRGPGEPVEERHRNVAASLQARAEEAFLHVLRHAATLAPGAPLCLAGGCAQNSVVVGKIRAHSPFVSVHVPPAAGDAGTAVGAALWTWRNVRNGERREQPSHPFLGPAHDSAEIRCALRARGIDAAWIEDEGSLLETVAGLLAEGQVVGWFHGRAEWGPRALGHRSLLADPRRPRLREELNLKIKRRESFRPFAPSLPEERAGDWFDDAAPTPFMTEVRPWSARRPRDLPAVTHVDGTARPQTVERAADPRFHGLLLAFERRTGVPVLLNTSFNENEPIVNRPEEALDCFLRTGMDALILGNAVVRRAPQGGRTVAPADG